MSKVAQLLAPLILTILALQVAQLWYPGCEFSKDFWNHPNSLSLHNEVRFHLHMRRRFFRTLALQTIALQSAWPLKETTQFFDSSNFFLQDAEVQVPPRSHRPTGGSLWRLPLSQEKFSFRNYRRLMLPWQHLVEFHFLNSWQTVFFRWSDTRTATQRGTASQISSCQCQCIWLLWLILACNSSQMLLS